jgi:signal transduction histidine kinase
VQIIGEQAARLNRLIIMLLDLSRLQSGQFHMEQDRVDLHELISRVVSEMQTTVATHTIRLEQPNSPIELIGDPLRLEQVLQNLIANAIKYSPERDAVEVRVSCQDRQVRVAIIDQGIGIPATELPQLFQRFYRAENAQSQHIPGMGIGLFIVKEIVRRHGGTIEVNSIEGQGSTFTVAFPLAVQQ